MNMLLAALAAIPDEAPVENVEAARQNMNAAPGDAAPEPEGAPDPAASDIAPPPLPLADAGPVDSALPGPPMMDDLGESFAPGTPVREVLSGQTGVVQEQPEGDFGDVIFVKYDSDGMTHPVMSDQIEKLEESSSMGPSPVTPPMDDVDPMAPAPMAGPDEDGAPAADSPIETMAATKPKSTIKGYKSTAFKRPRKIKSEIDARGRVLIKADFDTIVLTQDEAECLRDQLAEALDSMESDSSEVDSAVPMKTPQQVVTTEQLEPEEDFKVTTEGDEREMTYASFLAEVKALEQPTHEGALNIVGYLPDSWDLLVARLMNDGVVLRSKKEGYDVAKLVKGGLNDTEIRFVLGKKGVPMYALDPMLADLRAEPTIPKPAEEPGEGRQWVWDPTGSSWYLSDVKA